MTSLYRFIENQISVSSEFGIEALENENLIGAYFSDLDKPELSLYKQQFWRYNLPIEYIDLPNPSEGIDPEIIVQNIFDRLNRNVEKLNEQELRKAKYNDKEILNVIWELSEIPFWKNRLLQARVDIDRMEDNEFISELLFVLLEGRPLEAKPELVDTLYDKYAQSSIDWNEEKEKYTHTTQFMEALNLDYENFKISGVSHLYGLWCFSKYCIDNGIAPEVVQSKLVEFFGKLRSKDFSDENVDIYKKSMSFRTKSANQRNKRLQSLIRYCGIE